jgi:hypothetical protein
MPLGAGLVGQVWQKEAEDDALKTCVVAGQEIKPIKELLVEGINIVSNLESRKALA